MENENLNHDAVTESTVAAPIGSTPLPSFSACLRAGWEFTKQRFDMLLLLLVVSIPSILLGIMVEDDTDFFTNNYELAMVLILWSLISSPIVYFMAMYLAAMHESTPRLRDAWQYLLQNFWSYAWLFTIMSLVTLGGVLLFVIPSIIFSIYMIFGVMVFMKEDRRSWAAVFRSHELVAGYWWGIALRVLGVSLVWGLVSGLASVVPYVGSGIGAVLQTIGVMVMLYTIVLLYQARVDSGEITSARTPAPALYYTFAGLGTIVFIALVGLLSLAGVLLVTGFGA